MAMLDFLHAALLDPVQAALVLVVVLAYSGPLRLAVAAVAASVVSETIMAIAGLSCFSMGFFLYARPRAVTAMSMALMPANGTMMPPRP